jgi:integrase
MHTFLQTLSADCLVSFGTIGRLPRRAVSLRHRKQLPQLDRAHGVSTSCPRWAQKTGSLAPHDISPTLPMIGISDREIKGESAYEKQRGRPRFKSSKRGRPQSAERSIFLTLLPPHRPLAWSTAISQISKRILKKAAIEGPRLGAHRLRHTIAIEMVRRGSSFKEVVDVLGHKSLRSTGVHLSAIVPATREAVFVLRQ